MYTIRIFNWRQWTRFVQTTSSNVYHQQHAETSTSWAYVGEAKEGDREVKCILTSSDHAHQTKTTWSDKHRS